MGTEFFPRIYILSFQSEAEVLAAEWISLPWVMLREKPVHLHNHQTLLTPALDAQENRICRSVVSTCSFEICKQCEICATFLACIFLVVLQELMKEIRALKICPARIYLQ